MLKTTQPIQALKARLEVQKNNGECHDSCGCDVASCCLACPLAMCKYDDGRAYQRLRQQLRRQEQVAQAKILRSQGHHPQLIAQALQTNERTVYRYLAT